jgi:hypothetical protein
MRPVSTFWHGRRSGAKPTGRSVQGHRLQKVCAGSTPPAPPPFTILWALRMRFLRHGGIYRPDGGCLENQTWAEEPPPAGRSYPGPRTRREDHALLIVPMSSGRLFLDRVGRHQSPSPLHRHAQINMHSWQRLAKEDISTLQKSGHFYFALTPASRALTPALPYYKVSSTPH